MQWGLEKKGLGWGRNWGKRVGKGVQCWGWGWGVALHGDTKRGEGVVGNGEKGMGLTHLGKGC